MRVLGTLALTVALAATAATASITAGATQPAGYGQIHYLTDTDPDAVCMDGSPAAVYVVEAPAGSAHANDWMFFLQGGGLCTSPETCLERSKSPLGSSKSYPAAFPADQATGIISRNCSVNPEFCEYNLAHVQYCDGFLWSGARGPAWPVNGTDLYFRGAVIRRAALTFLASTYASFAAASSVMLTGCSAGGLGTFLHSNADAAYLRSSYAGLATAKIRAVPVSGMFLAMANANFESVVLPLVLGMVPITNSSDQFDAACRAGAPSALKYMCASALETFTYTSVPTFMLNSKSDAWQVPCTILGESTPGSEQCIGIDRYQKSGCAERRSFTSCTPELMLPILNFQQQFLTHISGNRGFTMPGAGAFIVSCYTHCEAMGDYYWSSTAIDGVTMSEAVRAWWHDSESAPASAHTHIDCERPDSAPFSCNPTCHDDGAMQGGAPFTEASLNW